MRTIAFEVPGVPAPWGVYTRYSRSPSKARLKAYQEHIQIVASSAMQGLPPYHGTIHLEVIFWLPIPPSAGKTPEARARWVEKHKLISSKWNPDRTNLLKGFEDALNGIVFVDDCQVDNGPPIKRWADTPGTSCIVRFL